MDVLASLLAGSSLGTPQALMLAFLLLFVPTLLFFRARVRAGRRPSLRPLSAFARLRDLVGLAAESGRALHLSLGTGSVHGTAAAETLAALDLLDALGQQAAAYGARPLVTTGDPTLLLAAQGVLRGGYEAQGLPKEYDPLSARLVAPDPAAYAAGVTETVHHEPLAAQVMAGRFGDEYLLMAEAAVHQGLEQVGGAAPPPVLPFVQATAHHPVLGEELFALGAYLRGDPAHVGSLLAQDWMRVLLILVIVVGIVAKTVLG
ncbi:MAG: DUF6754 domain-containing protein [Anaerolineae bacterium]